MIDDEFRADVWQAIDSSLGHGDAGRRFAVERILKAAEAWNRRAPAAPPGPPKGKMCTHGRPFRWYEPHETITCQHCCLELGDQCPTCRGKGRV